LGAAVFSTALFGVPGASPAGASAATTCNKVLAPGTYGTVTVPPNGVCLSNGPITIKGGLFVQPGGTFVLGDEEHPGHTGTITGGVHATNPASVQIHFTTINGGVDIAGGSGPFGGPFQITWNAIEDNVINGGASIQGYTGFWQGFIRNHVNGGLRFNGNVLADPDGNEVVTNVIHGSVSCAGNNPAPQVGDSEGLPNRVTGAKTGQCAAI
jgi:hypothetical protein